MLVPGLFGFVSATKWLKRIEFTTYAQRTASSEHPAVALPAGRSPVNRAVDPRVDGPAVYLAAAGRRLARLKVSADAPVRPRRTSGISPSTPRVANDQRTKIMAIALKTKN